jgi:L-ascorbate metabolism protein UlaG (beta-lactamase superfamily)
MFSSPRYQGPASEHYDGVRFYNQDRSAEKSFSEFFKWVTHRDQGPWGPYQAAQPGPPPPDRVGRERLRVTFVNHATVLIQMDGLNVLTDPIWSERASPVAWAGPRRKRPPGLRFEDLPPIDVVLISHNHYDHLDIPTLRRLAQKHRPRIFAGLGTARLLGNKKIDQARDLDWWQSTDLGQGVELTFVPAQHFSSRGLLDHHTSLWGGFVLTGPAGRVYFAGDTGFGPHFQQIRARLGTPRVALLPIGAFRPAWFMGPMHLSPADAVRAHRVLGAATSLGIHFGTFPLADDGRDEPVEQLQRALDQAGLTRAEFWVLEFGLGRDLPTSEADRAGVAPRAATSPSS